MLTHSEAGRESVAVGRRLSRSFPGTAALFVIIVDLTIIGRGETIVGLVAAGVVQRGIKQHLAIARRAGDGVAIKQLKFITGADLALKVHIVGVNPQHLRDDVVRNALVLGSCVQGGADAGLGAVLGCGGILRGRGFLLAVETGNKLPIFIGLNEDLLLRAWRKRHSHREDDVVAVKVLLLVESDLENLTGLDECLRVYRLDGPGERPGGLYSDAKGDQTVVKRLALGKHEGAIN